jgi:hypothetical protein
MLIKLIKHDIKSSYRELFPLYAGLLLFALIAALSVNPDREWLSVVTVLPFFALFIATSVILTLTIIKLFTNRLYSKEGYLTFTLPVSTLETFMSKIITATLWIFLTLIVYFLATSLFAGLWTTLNWSLIQVEFVRFEYYWNQIPWSTIIPEALRILSISLPHMLINILFGCSLILITVVFVNTSYVTSKKLLIGIIVYLVLNFIINNINANFMVDWLIYNDNFSFEVNWLMYALDLLYFGLISIGFIAGSIWLNDHKLELE